MHRYRRAPGAARTDRPIRDRRVRGDARAGRTAASHPHSASLRTARCGYYKVCRKAGEFALASGAVLLDRERNRFRAVIGATEGRPVVVDDARTILGEVLRPGAAVRLDESAANELLQRAGLTAPARLHITALARAAAQAMAQ